MMRTLPNPKTVPVQRRVASRFAKRLYLYRSQKNLTQEGLATACALILETPVDNTLISHLEHGRGYPRLPLLCAIADVLDREIDEFVEEL